MATIYHTRRSAVFINISFPLCLLTPHPGQWAKLSLLSWGSVFLLSSCCFLQGSSYETTWFQFNGCITSKWCMVKIQSFHLQNFVRIQRQVLVFFNQSTNTYILTNSLRGIYILYILFMYSVLQNIEFNIIVVYTLETFLVRSTFNDLLSNIFLYV